MQKEKNRRFWRLKKFFKKMPRKMQYACIVCFGVILLILLLLLRGCNSKQDAGANNAFFNENTSVSITALGNIQLGSELLNSAKSPDGSYNFSDCFSAITAYTASADITLANLEVNFVNPPLEQNDYQAPASLAQTLHLSGIDLVQTNNCASIQNGLSGLGSTIEVLESAGIDHVGTYASEEDRLHSNGIFIKTINGIRIAFVSFSKGLGGLSLPSGKEYAADVLYEDYATDYAVLNQNAILQKLAAANSAQPDLIIAMLHWGNEYDAASTEKQEAVIRLLMEQNVGVILGTHPNNVGKIEKREYIDKDAGTKTCYIAYSLGNFLTQTQSSHANESIIVNIQVQKNGVTGETTVNDFSYTPIFINRAERDQTISYQILPVRSAIQSSLFEEKKQELTDCLARLRQQTESDFDDGR